MALTLEHEPQDYSPAFNELPFIVSTDNLDAGLSVAVKKKISLISSEDLVILQFPPNSEGKWVVDLREIVSTLVDERIMEFIAEENYGLGEIGADSLGWYFVNFNETGVNPAGGLLTTHYFVFNGAFYREDFINFDHENYIIETDESRFLTDRNKKSLFIDDDYVLAWLQKDDDGVDILCDHLLVTAYDEDGTNATLELDCGNVDSLGTDISGFLRCRNVGAPSLNDASPDFITDTTERWTVVSRDDSNNETSETQEFYLRKCESRFDKMPVYWLNKEGGIETYTFPFKSIKRHAIERKKAERLNTITDSPLSTGVAIRESGEYVFNSIVKKSISVSSGFLRDYEMERLMGLIESPQVWLKDEAGRWHSMIVTNSEQEKKTVKNDKAFALVVDMDYSYKSRLQK